MTSRPLLDPGLSSTSKLNTPPTQPDGPRLTPQFCFNTRVLRDFLRLSRSQLDDTISTNLNSLVAPSQSRPFKIESTRPPSSNRSPRPPIPSETCTQFLHTVLFPAWHTRTQILTYCSVVAASPDPNDPDLASITLENAIGAQRKVDERLDPYSGRFFPREPRAEQLGALLRNENAVEAIVRERTWRVVNERCDGSRAERWDEELDRWTARGQATIAQ